MPLLTYRKKLILYKNVSLSNCFLHIYDYLLLYAFYIANNLDLDLRVTNNESILNQFINHLHDKASNEHNATKYIVGNQTIQINNMDFDCQTHCLEDIFNGVVEAINNYQQQCKSLLPELQNMIYNEGLINVIKIISKIWGDGKKYVYNQNFSLEAFCFNNNIEYIYKNIPSFPDTRKFHILRYLHTVVMGLPTIEQWYNVHKV